MYGCHWAQHSAAYEALGEADQAGDSARSQEPGVVAGEAAVVFLETDAHQRGGPDGGIADGAAAVDGEVAVGAAVVKGFGEADAFPEEEGSHGGNARLEPGTFP